MYHQLSLVLEQIATSAASGGGTSAGSVSNQFFTLASFASLASASTIVFVVSNGLQRAFNFNPRWLGLLLSIVVGCLGIYVAPLLTIPAGAAPGAIDYLIGLLNGFLIFATASGATSAAGSVVGAGNPKADVGGPSAAPSGAQAQLQTVPASRRGFLQPWF